MHTIYSDGMNTPEEMIRTAIDSGLTTIAITDHVWKTSDWVEKYVEELLDLKNKYYGKIEVLIGYEAKAINTNGEVDVSGYLSEKADFRLGSVHRIPEYDSDYSFLTREQVLNDKVTAYKKWLETTINLLANSDVDMIAHPFWALYKYDIIPEDEDIIKLFSSACRKRKFLEFSYRYSNINHYYFDAINNYPGYLTCLRYGSDSHSVEELRISSGKKQE